MMTYDIQSWIYRWFPEVVEYKDGSDLRVNCPFCVGRYGKEDSKYKLHISLHKQTCHCFRCGYSATWVRLVIDATGLPYYRAVGELYAAPSVKKFDDIRGAIDGTALVKRVQPEVTFPFNYRLLYSSTQPSQLVTAARHYMLKRGLGINHWERYSLGVSEDIGLRVIIPVEKDYWQARAIFPFMEPKYLNPKSDSADYIFNPSALTLYNEVVVCEGAFSAMSVGWNAIALLGKGTAAKVDRIARSPVSNIIVALDSDARREAVDLASTFKRAGKNVTIWKYTEGDPADSEPASVVSYNFQSEVRERLEL